MVSVENHPNIHAVGFAMDILTSLEKRIRGQAKEATPGAVWALLHDKINGFVVDVSMELDNAFGK